MPPKKSGESSTGAAGSTAGTKRKFHDTKSTSKSRSQTPNPVGSSSIGNGVSSLQDTAGTISFTPMNVSRASIGATARNGSRSRNGTTDHEPRDNGGDILGDGNDESLPDNKSWQRKNSAADLKNGDSFSAASSTEGNTALHPSKIPRRKKSSRFRESDGLSFKVEDDLDMTEAHAKIEVGGGTDIPKKGKLPVSKFGKDSKLGFANRPATKQSTLESHFRPVSQERTASSGTITVTPGQGPSASKGESDSPQIYPNLKIKLKVPPKTPDSQVITPADFYGNTSNGRAPALDLPAPTTKSKTADKGSSNGARKEKLTLPTNPPSSDTLSESFPSPRIPLESFEAEIIIPQDTEPTYSRGRRATRNAAPYYSGPPRVTTDEMPSSSSRNVSPSKSAKKATRSVSPKRGGKKTVAATTPIEGVDFAISNSKLAANDRRRGRGGRKLYDEFGQFRDLEPSKPVPAYGANAPSTYQFGMMPFGTHPPKERVDEVFNRDPPKEPEPRSDMTSSIIFANLWGTVGNKDVTILKGNQGRAKKQLMKAGKLDKYGEWVFPDTEGVELIAVTNDNDGNEPMSAGPLSSGRARTRTPRLTSVFGQLETSTSPSPSFPPDHPARSTEDLLSPASENIPETPREVTTMDIDGPGLQSTRRSSEARVVEDTLDIESPSVSEVDSGLKDPTSKPPLLAIIRQAKAAAENAGNSEVVGLLSDLEAAGDTPETRNVLGQILRGGFPSRLSPVTVPGGKRTLTQRQEDEFEAEKSRNNCGPRWRVLKPKPSIHRGKRPDEIDNGFSDRLEKKLAEAREREAALNAKLIPKEYTCFRSTTDRTGRYLHQPPKDRGFDVDGRDQKDEYFPKYNLGSPPPQRQLEVKAPVNSPRGKRRKMVVERSNEQIPGEEVESASMDLDEQDQLIDDDESPCTVCGGSGAPLVICDGAGCREEQHYDCADPPLTEAEVDAMPEWYCKKCTAKRSHGRKGPEYKGLFGKLFESHDKQNPRMFELPKDIREYFSGVETGELGVYKKSIDYYELTRTKDKDLRAYDHYKMLNELPFESQLNGYDGKLAVCYHCRQTRMRTNHGELIACDYCEMYWHKDCLPEALVEPPAIKAFGDKPNDHVLLEKWKCPLHLPDAAFPLRLRRRPNEGRDTAWPPKHRIRAPSPPAPEMPSQNWAKIYRHGKERMLPEEGVVLSFIPGVNQTKAQRELDEQTFTGVELQAIEILRSLIHTSRTNPTLLQSTESTTSPSTNQVENFIMRFIPQGLRSAIEASITTGALEGDSTLQLEILRSIKDGLEQQLAVLPL
ncbi:hypothetical protein ABW19_dt0206067 [Dactylella cylindrospora]|nr:hypothetical protein ABW19_dt0206067 [Dactylella cylindrospora]